MSGRILVMDFGLARTLEGDGMTQTGALVGTMEYMSPEQALAKELDQRSDIFSAGLIFYELLTGQMPFRADSALASLIKRTQERARPISEHDNPSRRHSATSSASAWSANRRRDTQTAKELLADLEAWQGKRAAGAIAFPSVEPWGQTIPWQWLGGIAARSSSWPWGLPCSGTSFARATRLPPWPILQWSLAILPFHNASARPVTRLAGPSLGDMLSTDVGQSAHLRTVSPDRLQQVLHDLRIGTDTVVDPATCAAWRSPATPTPSSGGST